MKLRQISLAVALAAVAGSAQATLWTGLFNTSNGANFHDGVLGPFYGWDIHSTGSAAFFCATPSGCGGGTVANGAQLNPGTIGNIALGDSVLTLYQGIVSNFNAPLPGIASPNLRHPGNPGGTYQITLAAMFYETVVGGFILPSPLIGASATLLTTSGKFGFYYDHASLPGGGTFASISLGTGFTDGMPILEGTINPGGPTTYTVFPVGSASGGSTIVGKVLAGQVGVNDPLNVNDVVGFMPDTPDGMVATSTIQYGIYAPNLDHQTVNFFDNANGWTKIAVNKNLTVRADANTEFVPEPATLALLGLGLAGLGLSLRRRAA